MGLNDFIFVEEIGKGSFAKVFKAKRMLDSKLYAVKVVPLKQAGSKELRQALKEARLLSSLNHTNIIGYRQAFTNDDHSQLYLVTDYAQLGDVKGEISAFSKIKRNMPEQKVWRIALHVASGLAYLHQNRILHRDIKASNVLAFRGVEGTVYKIADFNISRLLLIDPMAQTQAGTPIYCSPEIWQKRRYDQKSDIYSMGCLLYQLCAQAPPFRAKSTEELGKLISKKVRPPLLNHYSQNLNNLIWRCLSHKASARPSAEQIHLLAGRVLKSKDVDDLTVFKAPSQPQTIADRNSKIPKRLSRLLPTPRYQAFIQDQGSQQIQKKKLPIIRHKSEAKIDQKRGLIPSLFQQILAAFRR